MHPYNADYYLNGPESGLSNYKDYHWLPDKTIPMTWKLRWQLGIKGGDSVLDYGCARGYTVKALRQMGIDAYGFDISEWAIHNCDPDVRAFVSNILNTAPVIWDHVIAKDVFEHIEPHALRFIVEELLVSTRKQLFIIVPLAKETGGEYGCPVDEQDSTHIIRWTLPDWLTFLQEISSHFTVSGGYQVPVLKPNCYEFPKSYGFFTMRRTEP